MLKNKKQLGNKIRLNYLRNFFSTDQLRAELFNSTGL